MKFKLRNDDTSSNGDLKIELMHFIAATESLSNSAGFSLL